MLIMTNLRRVKFRDFNSPGIMPPRPSSPSELLAMLNKEMNNMIQFILRNSVYYVARITPKMSSHEFESKVITFYTGILIAVQYMHIQELTRRCGATERYPKCLKGVQQFPQGYYRIGCMQKLNWGVYPVRQILKVWQAVINYVLGFSLSNGSEAGQIHMTKQLSM